MISQEYNANSVLQISITKRKSSPSEVDTMVPSFCSLYDSHGHQLDILPLPHYPGATNIVSSPEIVTKMQPLISKEATSASDVYELTMSSLPANCVAIYFTLHGNVPQPSDCDAAPTNLVHLCKVEVEARVISQRVADTPSPCSFVGEGFDSDISCVLMLRILRNMADGSWLLESKMSSMKDIPNHLYLQPVVEKLMLKDYCERSRRDMAARTLVYHLRKGESYPIPFGLTDLTVALGWDRTKLDIDVSALCLDASGAVVDLIYFGHLVGCGGSVRHGGDTRGSKTNAAEEILTIQTSKVPQPVRAILVTLSVFTMGKTLAHCSGEYARLFCTEDSQLGASSRVERLTDLARVVDVQNGGKNGLLFVALTRNGPFTHRPTGDSAWSFHALMEPATGRKGEELKAACTAWYTSFTQLKVLTKSPRLAPPSKIILIRGKHLKACDVDGLSDPYVKVYSLPSREKLYQTAVCAKTLNPVWNECVDIPRITQDILLTVKDKDMFNDDHIGEVVLKRCHFAPGEYTIALQHPADDSCGEITIRCIA